MIWKEFDDSSVHIEIWLQLNRMVSKIIRKLVFLPAKMVLSQLFLSFAVVSQ